VTAVFSSAGRGAALPAAATVIFVVGLALVLATGASAGTLGYDFEAYAQAAQRLIDGRALYDPAVDLAGGFAVFLYPPPFAIAFVPFALLGPLAGLWAWTALLAGCLVAAVALLPVPDRVRWVVLLLAGLHWPTLYAIRLGQVGPILLLLFVLGWRWLERPAALASTIALGGLIKVQPGLLAGWALLVGRWRTAVLAVAGAAAVSLVTLPIVGVEAWSDYRSLLGRVIEPVTTPHNFTPGAVAFQAGVSIDQANLIQWATAGLVLAGTVFAARRRSLVAGYLVAVVATQFLSPLLWDHYAVILLGPVAWLLSRGSAWAVAIPLATAWPLVGITPAVAYPVIFGVVIAAVVASGDRHGPDAVAGTAQDPMTA